MSVFELIRTEAAEFPVLRLCALLGVSPSGRNRVARLMRESGLLARTPRRYRVTTNSKHGFAVAPNRAAPGLIHHNNRGSQYASNECRQMLTEHEVAASTSRAGDCYDNAVAESFFACLKRERLGRQHCATRTEAYDAIAAYIDGFYKSTRRHSTLNYQSPIDFKRASIQRRAA